MTVKELMDLTGSTLLNEGPDTGREVKYGYACDLLSWVMSHGAADTAWITVMTHMNAIAVASLLDFSCVIIPEGIEAKEDILEKAAEEGIAVLRSEKTAFELSGMLYERGIRAPVRG